MNHLVFHILPKIIGLQSDSNHQQQGQSWNATEPNSTYVHPSIRLHQIQYPQFDFINPMTAPNYLAQQSWSYQACQQSVQFVAVLDAVLPSVAMIPSFSVALADAIRNFLMHPWRNLMSMKLSLAEAEPKKQFSARAAETSDGRLCAAETSDGRRCAAETSDGRWCAAKT